MRHWRKINLVSVLMSPLAGLFWLATTLRRWLYIQNWFPSFQLGVPVVVVGNITAGGTGKTPIVIALSKALQEHGYRPGIISRGYGGKAVDPRIVTPESLPSEVGDEPVLIAWKTGVPVAVAGDRVAAARLLLARNPGVDVVLADDGLQHYRLGRQIELAVVDGDYGLGNAWMMPAGPLREPANRLRTVDAVLITCRAGGECRFKPAHPKVFKLHHGPGMLYKLCDHAQRKALDHAFSETVDAIAAIARPESFFDILRRARLDVRAHVFADHHDFTVADIPARGTVIMTEKDAVKCSKFVRPDWWALEWQADLQPELVSWLTEALNPDHKS